jgi:hypothetical protein
MPTPNKQWIDTLESELRSLGADTDLLNDYHIAIIASEREAAADRSTKIREALVRLRTFAKKMDCDYQEECNPGTVVPCPSCEHVFLADEAIAILDGQSLSKGDGSEERPFTDQFIGKCFERADNEGKRFSFGVCERDDGYEITVDPVDGPWRHYTLHPDGSITDLDGQSASPNALDDPGLISDLRTMYGNGHPLVMELVEKYIALRDPLTGLPPDEPAAPPQEARERGIRDEAAQDIRAAIALDKSTFEGVGRNTKGHARALMLIDEYRAALAAEGKA